MTYTPTRFIPLFVLALIAAWLSPNQAAAQLTGDAVLTADLVSQRAKAHAGDRFALAVILDYADGWHSWPNKPVIPEGVEDVIAIPTRLSLTNDSQLPAGVLLRIDAAQWPAPAAIKTGAFSEKPIKILAYHDRTIVFVPVTIDASAKAGVVTVSVNVDYQACDDQSCRPDDTVTARASFEIVSASTPTADSPDQSIFKSLDTAALANLPTAPAAPIQAAPAASPTTATPSLFGFSLPNPHSALGVIILFLVSALGGAVLNLTPCVLPVIPIKIMTLVQHAGSPTRTLMLGLYMFCGVVAFWFVVGLPMAIFSATLDPSRLIFGTWWITLSLGLIIAAMGLGIMGLFSINLPQSAYLINPKADTAWGSFVFGVMTAILGLPCFGFVAGGLLAGAAALGGEFLIMVVFAGLGVGMAFPYLVLAAKPGLVEKIPRTGPASELVKQVMGLMLLAAAAFFIAGGIKGVLIDMPYLNEAIKWWVVSFFILLASAWLTVRTLQIAKKAWPKVVMPAIAAFMLVLTVGFAWTSTQTDKEDWILAHAADENSSRLVTGAWIHYNDSLLARARAAGHIVVVDFTADWCINCKVLKRTVLDSSSVRPRLQMSDVVLLEVDVTTRTAPGWAYLQSLGQTGVPTLAIYGPATDKPIIYNAYTPDIILAAIERAKGNTQVSAAPTASPAVTPRTP